LQTIRHAILANIGHCDGPACKLVTSNSQYVSRGGDPQPSSLVLSDPIYLAVQYAGYVPRNLYATRAEERYAIRRSDPEHAGRVFEKAVHII
jgi:hypothetical protein